MSFAFLRPSLAVGRFADIPPSNGKSCTCCGQWKPVADFYKQTNGLLGRKATCIVCFNADTRRRNKERKSRG